MEQRPLGYTTLEESRKLLSLEVPPALSDYFYDTSKETEVLVPRNPTKEEEDSGNIVHCWSLGMLIEILPKTIWLNEVHKDLEIGHEKDYYEVYYISGYSATHVCRSKYLIEAVIELLIWVIENNIQTEKC